MVLYNPYFLKKEYKHPSIKKVIRIVKEGVKLLLFVDNMILYKENPKEFTKKAT